MLSVKNSYKNRKTKDTFPSTYNEHMLRTGLRLKSFQLIDGFH